MKKEFKDFAKSILLLVLIFISTLMFAMGGLALVAAIFVIPGVDVFIVSLAVMIISYYSCIKAFKDIIIINKKEKNIKR